MKKSEMIGYVQAIIDNEILNIPNSSYIMKEHREDYAEFILNFVMNKLETKIEWEPED